MDTRDAIGDRLVELLKRNGYRSRTGRSKYGVDLARFTIEYGYIVTMMHKWLSGEARPSDENLVRLARDLGTSPGYILFGPEDQATKPRRPMHPIAGGSDATWGERWGHVVDTLPLIRHWFRNLWRMTGMSRRWAAA